MGLLACGWVLVLGAMLKFVGKGFRRQRRVFGERGGEERDEEEGIWMDGGGGEFGKEMARLG